MLQKLSDSDIDHSTAFKPTEKDKMADDKMAKEKPVKKKAANNFHESYQDEHPDLPSEKSTGIVFAGVSAVIGGIIYYSSGYTNVTALVTCLWITAVFLILAQFAPKILKPLNVAWFKFSMLLFKVVNPIIMLLLFAVLFIPAGLIMQLRLDPLGRKKNPDAKSYWVDKSDKAAEPSMKNQF